jgi:hypothetical protein
VTHPRGPGSPNSCSAPSDYGIADGWGSAIRVWDIRGKCKQSESNPYQCYIVLGLNLGLRSEKSASTWMFPYVFWYIKPCSPMKVYRRFLKNTSRPSSGPKPVACFILVSCSPYYLALKMEAICWLSRDCKGFISQKTRTFIPTAVEISNSTMFTCLTTFANLQWVGYLFSQIFLWLIG